MLELEDYQRFLEHIKGRVADDATKIRLANAIREAIKKRPGLAEELGLNPATVDSLPNF